MTPQSKRFLAGMIVAREGEREAWMAKIRKVRQLLGWDGER